MKQQMKHVYSYSTDEKNILNLEKIYMERLKTIFSSPDFSIELKKIENYVKNNYNYLSSTYNKKNKIEIAVERLIRYFIYTKLTNITGIYPSPISCDMAIETDDCILNIDSKTIDSVGNRTDINYFHFENNQSSFIHCGFGSQPEVYTGIPVKTYLPPIDPETGKPLLTYFLKIVYSDDGQSFSLFHEKNITLTCLPNGILSQLFNYDIVFNFKTYTYSLDKSFIASKQYTSQNGINFEKSYSQNPYKFLEDLDRCNFNLNLLFQNPINVIIINGRPAIISNNEAWVPVKRGTGNNIQIFLENIQQGQTARVEYPILTERYDHTNQLWLGHQEWKI
ncbi:MAG: hypothetical protein ACRC6U_06670 [Fusobacteriaceae bacterium]